MTVRNQTRELGKGRAATLLARLAADHSSENVLPLEALEPRAQGQYPRPVPLCRRLAGRRVSRLLRQIQSGQRHGPMGDMRAQGAIPGAGPNRRVWRQNRWVQQPELEYPFCVPQQQSPSERPKLPLALGGKDAWVGPQFNGCSFRWSPVLLGSCCINIVTFFFRLFPTFFDHVSALRDLSLAASSLRRRVIPPTVVAHRRTRPPTTPNPPSLATCTGTTSLVITDHW